MRKFLALPLLLLLAAACSSTGDPESEFLAATSSVPAVAAEGTSSPASEEAVPQSAPSATAPPIVPTLPAEIPELPRVLWPTVDDTSPTAEDAIKDYLLHHPSETFGYKFVVGCQGLTAETAPNTLCSREPTISEDGDRQVYTYQVGRPPPATTDYSIGVQGSDSEGWWILWANTYRG